MASQRLTRRDTLKYGLIGVGGLVLPLALRDVPGGSGLEVQEAGRPSKKSSGSPPVTHFDVPLPIPPVLQPTSSDATADYYTITMQQATQQILPGYTTTIWGYNGSFPGPTIRATVGRKIVVKHINNLSEGMSVHFHGGVVEPGFDGYPESLIQPGTSFDYHYPNQQHGATLWYHDHAVHNTGRHVYMGLAGFYLLRDDALENQLNLPQGEYEIPLLLQDRIFDSTGALVYNTSNHSGVVGDVQLVNGAPWPRLQVKQRKYRFRLVNGSNLRRYDLTLSNGQPFIQLGTDSGFLAAPVNQPKIRLFQGERADVVIDFSAVPVGSTVILKNTSADASGGMTEIMLFEVIPNTATDDSQVPAVLEPYEILQASSAVRTREFRFDRKFGVWVINGKTWDKNRFDAEPRLGETEIWKFVNSSIGWYHPVHPHLIDFQILSRNGQPPWPWERGRKDTVGVAEANTVEVIIKWFGFPGPYAFHCHNLEHEDFDMMTQFRVLPA